MKSAYGLLLVCELLFLWIILLATDDTDRGHNYIVISLSILVFLANLIALLVYPFRKTEFQTKVMKYLTIASMISIFLLTCTGGPNKEVPIAKNIQWSKITSETSP